jgi:2-hydroxy-6-oxonona-2,4-dienedioate hydrolase
MMAARRSTLLLGGIGALGLTLCSLIYLGFERDLESATARVIAGSHLAETPCGPIEYGVAGDGPAILVVHGAGGGFDQGIAFGRALAEQGFRVIAMSRFGYLRTPLPPDASAAAQADAHACLLDALHVQRAVIIGASAGAPSSMQFALRHPQRTLGLVLLVPAAYVPRDGDEPPVVTPPGTRLLFDTALRSDFLLWAAIRIAREFVIASVLATPPSVVARASPEEQRRVQEILSDLLPIRPRRTGLLNDAIVTSAIPRYELERITAPTLVMSAMDDRFGTYAIASYTAKGIRGARFAGFPTGGHLWVGHQQEVEVEILTFVRQQPEVRGQGADAEPGRRPE